MPVSETAKVSQSSDSRSHGQADGAVVGELGGVQSRLKSAWRTLVWSACIVPRSSAHATTSVLAFFSTSGWTIASTSSDESGDLERLQEQVHPAGLDLGEVQDVVDQPQQVLAGRVDPLEVRQEGVCVEVLGLLLEHLGVADDGVQRRPQLVAHVRQELRLVLAGLGKLAVRSPGAASNSRAFSMAMTAWSANVSRSAICAAVKGALVRGGRWHADRLAFAKQRRREQARYPAPLERATAGNSLRSRPSRGYGWFVVEHDRRAGGTRQRSSGAAAQRRRGDRADGMRRRAASPRPEGSGHRSSRRAAWRSRHRHRGRAGRRLARRR